MADELRKAILSSSDRKRKTVSVPEGKDANGEPLKVGVQALSARQSIEIETLNATVNAKDIAPGDDAGYVVAATGKLLMYGVVDPDSGEQLFDPETVSELMDKSPAPLTRLALGDFRAHAERGGGAGKFYQSPTLKACYTLAEKLGTTAREILDLPQEEIIYWVAFFDLQRLEQKAAGSIQKRPARAQLLKKLHHGNLR